MNATALPMTRQHTASRARFLSMSQSSRIAPTGRSNHGSARLQPDGQPSFWNTAKNHFNNIDTAMDQSGGQIKINCGCNQSYYAYVYPTRPYEIFVCRAFWNAPTTGTDSKAGTLIHEMSHFNVVAGTDDHVYGPSGAKSLAISNPDNALDNADNHEYFAENTPSQN